ncbi:MAG: hypothetical protein WCQ89_06845 [Verrucomicrobiota bacterium]|jgi:hypothetical protein
MTNIDVPDFDEALQQDPDGSFHRAVEAHLEQALAALRAETRAGLAPLEFEQAGKIEAALLKATDVVRLSAHLSKSH